MWSYERLAELIEQKINDRRPEELQQRLQYANIFELTRAFAILPPEIQSRFLELIELDKSVRIIKLSLRLGIPLKPFLKKATPEFLVKLIAACDPDDARKLLHLMPDKEAQETLETMPIAEATTIRKLDIYPRDTIGSLMNPNVISLLETLSIKEALEEIRTNVKAEMVFYLYVTDKETHLKGVVSLRKLVTAEPELSVKDIMDTRFVTAQTSMDYQEVKDIFEKTGYLALPVVDFAGKLAGIVSRDDVTQKLQQETENDLFHINRVSPQEFHGAPLHKIIPLRLPWLAASLIGGILNAMILNQYTHLLEVLIVLTVFIPVLLGLGETVATQTSTLIIRGLAIGLLENKQIRSLIYKELFTGLVLGLASGLALGGFAYLWTHTLVVGIILMLSVTLSITVASLVGTIVPLIFKALDIDPALASSSFVLTASDLGTISLYLLIAAQMLSRYH
jgi:magnesium transporter